MKGPVVPSATPVALSPVRSRRTRRLLLDAAITLFAERGYSGTSVQAVSRRARVNVSLVSYHFKGKAGLYRACLDQFTEIKFATAKRALAAPENTPELEIRFQLFTEELLACYLEQPNLTRIVHRFLELDDPPMGGGFLKALTQLFDRLVEFLEAARQKGLIRAEVEPRMVARSYYGMMIHLIRTDRLYLARYGTSLTDKDYRAQLTRQIVDLCFNGIRSKKDLARETK